MNDARRDYQIRIVSDYGEEEVLCFTDLTEATAKYWEIYDDRHEGEGSNAYEMELLEVLLQHTAITAC